MHRFLLHNEEIRSTSENLVSPGQVGLLNGWGVFSTLRVKGGVLFAWERHLARMERDAARMHIPFPRDTDLFRTSLLKLVEANNAPDSTLRVVVVRNRGGMFEGPALQREYDIIAFTKDLTQWKDGTRLMVKPRARMGGSEFSGTKILSWSMNLTWLEEAQCAGFDEMLLLDETGLVSECTGANVFVVKGSSVRTPPLSCGCLPGVTRAILLEDIRVPGVTIEEKAIELGELKEADDVFLTSSTRDLLGVAEVGGERMKGREAIRLKLLEAFHLYLGMYINRTTARAFSPVS